MYFDKSEDDGEHEPLVTTNNKEKRWWKKVINVLLLFCREIFNVDISEAAGKTTDTGVSGTKEHVVQETAAPTEDSSAVVTLNFGVNVRFLVAPARNETTKLVREEPSVAKTSSRSKKAINFMSRPFRSNKTGDDRGEQQHVESPVRKPSFSQNKAVEPKQLVVWSADETVGCRSPVLRRIRRASPTAYRGTKWKPCSFMYTVHEVDEPIERPAGENSIRYRPPAPTRDPHENPKAGGRGEPYFFFFFYVNICRQCTHRPVTKLTTGSTILR